MFRIGKSGITFVGTVRDFKVVLESLRYFDQNMTLKEYCQRHAKDPQRRTDADR